MINKVYSLQFTVYSSAVFIMAIIVICPLLANCFAQSVSSSELINKAKLYDGKAVVYTGEVIGDIMKRGEFAWVNVNDGENAIGIWISAASAKGITYTGSYKSLGDRIAVVGVFNRACIEHGGDLDIHATGLRIISSGRLVQEGRASSKKELAILLLGTLCLTWILTLLKRK